MDSGESNAPAVNPTIAPCLWLRDAAEDAASFYLDTIGAGRVIARTRFPQGADNPVGRPRGSLMSVEIEVLGQRLTVLNGGPQFVLNPSISLFIQVATAAEAERLFGALSAAGETLMPLGEYPWSPCFGWANDRFGVSWQVMATDAAPVPSIAPFLLFCNVRFGYAAPALDWFCRIFPNSRIDGVERFGVGELGGPGVKRGSCRLAGQRLLAMDSALDHRFTFNEALSLQVLCDDQAEVDRYWRELSVGGEPGRCGWLTDRFGISWQVVPARWISWLGSGADAAAHERVFDAMQDMTKIEVAVLEEAFAG